MVRPGSPGIRLLESLPQRPPTPPRESDHSKIEAEGLALQRDLSNPLRSRTPLNNSTDQTNELSTSTSDKSRKRVVWSTWTEYKEPSMADSPLQDNLRQLPSSGELKPTKSILKPYNGIIPVNGRSGIGKLAAPHTYPNFATMLDSIVKQLAGEDRSSRIDAYLTLSGVLKASDDVPDPRAMRDKMGLLIQYIQRDMSARTVSGALDTVIINNALILLAFFVWNTPIADCLNNEFCSFVVEHAIGVLKDPFISKEVVKHLLFILGRQNFSSKVMTAERIRRLIESLVNIEEHVKGRSIILGRIGIYRKLLKQSRTSMLASVQWVETLFMDMTSNSREVRAPAVAFGLEAALLLGTEKQVSRAVMDLFRRDVDETKWAHSFSRKLGLMVQNKQDGDLVPQVWSIVVLFLRYRAHQLEHWEFMMTWMHVIEKCFNSSDHDIKTQANLAWNRLVFAIQPNEATAPTMIKSLGKVLDLQLKRKLVGRHAKEARKVTLGSLCNLLYYALNPNATFSQIDLYWDEYVVQLIGNTLVAREQVISETNEEDLACACEIMSALLDISPKAWRLGRANETATIKADELPSIDPKWIRKNAQKVFQVIGPLIQVYFRDLIRWETSIELLWSRFVVSVGAAGAKEVKVSNDTMSSVASIFTLLYKLWEGGLKGLPGAAKSSSLNFQKAITGMVNMATSSLGLLPFTERLLAMGPQESFAIVATPSHHPHKHRGEIKCPLHHLFILLLRPPIGVNCDEVYLEMAQTILEPFFDDRKTRASRLELGKDLCQLLPQLNENSAALLVLWRVIAGFAITSFDLKSASGTSSNSNGSLDVPLGSEYRSFVKILEHGILLPTDTPWPEWKELFDTTIAHVTADVGQSGRAISVIEPLSRALTERASQIEQTSAIAYCTVLVSNASYPVDKQGFEAARRRLWGTSNPSTKSGSFDPYSYLYVYVQLCLQQSYNSSTSDVPSGTSELLSSITNLIRTCSRTHTNSLLAGIQDGLSPWIIDESTKFCGRQSSTVTPFITTLWSTICDAISTRLQTDSSLLHSLEILICAGFESKHKHIVSSMITLWNATFGNESALEYPPRVTAAILRVQPITDLQLPSFPNHHGNEIASTGPTFEDESQDENLHYDIGNYNTSKGPSSREHAPQLGSSGLPNGGRRISSHVAVELPHLGSRKRVFQGTPESSTRKLAKKNLTPKLRHDDSQIEFAPIHSSPRVDAVLDSQLLTDRQREVKERQRATEAVFANVETSPGLRTKFGLSHPKLKSDPLTCNGIDPEKPSTPELPLQEKALFDDFITSSPTPSRGGFRLQMDIDLIDPPSSPPQQSRPMFNPEIMVSESSKNNDNNPKSDLWDVTSSPPPMLHGTSRTSTDLGPSAQVVEDMIISGIDHDTSLLGNSLEYCQVASLRDRPTTPEEHSSSLAIEQQASRTPNDVFVDALSSPAPPTPNRATNSDQIYTDGMEYDQRSTAPNAMQQNDSQITYSLSEADEDSMVRLITKFDKPGLRHEHSHNEISIADDAGRVSGSTRGGIHDSQARDVVPLNSSMPLPVDPKHSTDQNSGCASLESRLSGNHSIILKSAKVKQLRYTSLIIGSKVVAQEQQAQASQQLMESPFQDKDTNKLIRRPKTTKGKIVDHSTEIPNSLIVNDLGSTTRTEEAGINSELSSQIMKEDVPATTSAQQLPFMDVNRRLVSANSETYGNQDSNISFVGSKFQKDEHPINSVTGQKTEMFREGTADPFKARDIATEIAPDLYSETENENENEVDQTSRRVISKFEQILSSLRTAALTREEAQKMEDLLWDVKGELYAAEKRGRLG